MNLRGSGENMRGVGEMSSRKSRKYSTHMKFSELFSINKKPKQTNGEGSAENESQGRDEMIFHWGTGKEEVSLS